MTSVHINGGVQRGGESLLNGVSMVNPSGSNGIWSAFFDFPQSPDMVSELRVLTSNNEPEYGATAGGVLRPTLSIPTLQERQGDFSDWKDANGNLIRYTIPPPLKP